MSTILMTGAAGRVGTAVRPWLRERFTVRCLDRRQIPDPAPDEEVLTGDLNDPHHLAAALDGVDGVLHLACVHGLSLTFDESIDVNYRATIALLDAARLAGVRRLVYASSHHVFGALRRDDFDSRRSPVAPDAYYGLGKAFGELACSMFAHRFGLQTLVVRIGNADPTVTDDRTLRMWVSARDLAQLFVIGLTHPSIGFEVAYGVSRCPSPLFDDPVGERLGYRPQDDAADHLDPAFAGYGAMPAPLGRDHVGGAYAVAPLPAVSEKSA